MKKSLLFILLFLFVYISLAVSPTANENETVYVDPETQDEIYNMLIDESFGWDSSIKFVKESISRVYRISSPAYAESDILDLKPFMNDTRFYYVKTVYENGEFAGNMQFKVVDGVAKQHSYIASAKARKEQSGGNFTGTVYRSLYYADCEEEIKSLLKCETEILPCHVKHVDFIGLVSFFGEGFYVDNGDIQAIIFAGGEYASGRIEPMRVCNLTELKESCKKSWESYKRSEAAAESWLSEHPDEGPYMGGGYAETPTVNTSGGGEKISSHNGSWAMWIIAACSAAIACISVVFATVYVAKVKRKIR